MLRSILIALIFLSQNAFAFDPVKKSSQTNPDIGINVTFLGQAASAASEYDNGFEFEEMEVQFSSAIDPYWNGNAMVAVHHHEADPAEVNPPEYDIEAEEVYFENLSLPGWAFRLGKQKLYFGKLNHVHPHAFPFIDAAFTQSKLLGEEGLNETGVSASYLLPSSWYSELILQAFTGENENIFGSAKKGDLAEAVYFKNLWEVRDDATIEWILSGAFGENTGEENTQLLNTALTYKWRPKVDGLNNSLSATAEFTHLERKKAVDENTTLVTSVDPETAQAYWIKYQFRKEWAAGIRYEYASAYEAGDLSTMINTERNSAIISYYPSEFSQVQLQYDVAKKSVSDEREHRVGLQFNFSMGAHPAHSY